MTETAHLLLRKASFADCDLFAEWESRDDVIQFFCKDGSRNLDTITKQFHEMIHDKTKEWLTVLLKSDNRPIGRVSLTSIDELNDTLELSKFYIGDRSERGKGYGGEIVEAVLEYSFTSLDMHRVSISYLTSDKLSEHLYPKLGFRKEGVLIGAGKVDGEYFDMGLVAMLRGEWEERQSTNKSE